MMGERQVRQDALFYEFSLERHVPERHLLRAIDRFVRPQQVIIDAQVPGLALQFGLISFADGPVFGSHSPGVEHDALLISS